jgi:hypothetical protein
MEIVTFKRILGLVMFSLGFLPPFVWFLYFFFKFNRSSFGLNYAVSTSYSAMLQLGFQWGLITTLLWLSAALISPDTRLRVIFGFFSAFFGIFTLTSGFFYAVYSKIN